MLYAEGYFSPLAQPRPRARQRTIHVTLILSLILHLILWSVLNSTTHREEGFSHTIPLAVRLITMPTPTPALSPAVSAATPPQRPQPRESAPARPSEQALRDNTHDTNPVASATEMAPTTLTPHIMEPPRHDAAYLHNPEPNYPLVARRRHLEGTVVIRIQVGSDGSSLQSQLQKSSGHAMLDQAALETVSQWRFVPARHGDERVIAWVEVPITFRLAAER